MHCIQCIMDFEAIGAAIRAARKDAGRTQHEVAANLGMSRATISAIENGSVGEIGVRKLDALCASLGLDIFVAPKRRRPTLQELRTERREDRARARG